jgi:hypothetical protein
LSYGSLAWLGVVLFTRVNGKPRAKPLKKINRLILLDNSKKHRLGGGIGIIIFPP